MRGFEDAKQGHMAGYSCYYSVHVNISIIGKGVILWTVSGFLFLFLSLGHGFDIISFFYSLFLLNPDVEYGGSSVFTLMYIMIISHHICHWKMSRKGSIKKEGGRVSIE